MRFDGLLKHLGIGLALAVAIYVTSYWFIDSRRTGKGPWSVRFSQTEAGVPEFTVNHSRLGIQDVRFTFPGGSPGTNQLSALEFDQPRPWPFPVPGGEVIFEDLTFLPGTVTLVLHGNEIELLPRVLIVNRREHPWQSGARFTLTPTNRPPPVVKPKRRKSS